jgi:hypothetical protein
LQTSDALGAAAAQPGPDAQAAVELHKQGGLSHGKVAPCLAILFGNPLSRGGSVHTALRAAARSESGNEAVRQMVGQSDWVVPDETGGGWAGTPYGCTPWSDRRPRLTSSTRPAAAPSLRSA